MNFSSKQMHPYFEFDPLIPFSYTYFEFLHFSSYLHSADNANTRFLKLLEQSLHRRSPYSPKTSLLRRCYNFLSLDSINLLNHFFHDLLTSDQILQALLYVAAEDEAFMAFNREMDAQAFSNERRSVSSPSDSDSGWDSLEEMPLAGRNISQWMSELDAIAKEVEVELLSRDIGCHLIEVLEAVNVVLLEFRGFKRISIPLDSDCSYLHSVLSYRHCSGNLLLFQKTVDYL